MAPHDFHAYSLLTKVFAFSTFSGFSHCFFVMRALPAATIKMIVLSDLSNGPSLLRLRLHFDGSCVIYCFNSFSTSSSFISLGVVPQQSRLKRDLPEVLMERQL
jgi:hypothetical protein